MRTAHYHIKGHDGSPKGYIRDSCALLGGWAGLTAAVIKMAIEDRDWAWLLGREGSERDFWLELGEIESSRFERLVAGRIG